MRHSIFVRSFGETQDIVSKAGKELTKREIVLVDQSAAEVLIKSFMASSFYHELFCLSNFITEGVLDFVGRNCEEV